MAASIQITPTEKPGLGSGTEASAEEAKLVDKLEEFIVYLDNSRSCIVVNYGDRYRHEEPIASGFVESAVNQVASKRFVKRQQMAWRPRFAHNLLQIRTAMLNDQLRSYIERWYPFIAGEKIAAIQAATRIDGNPVTDRRSWSEPYLPLLQATETHGRSLGAKNDRPRFGVEPRHLTGSESANFLPID